MTEQITQTHPRVVIIGGGFGGLYAAKALRDVPVNVTLVDQRNFHLFQPLLYQVATGGVSPGDIASPLRAVFKRQRNLQVIHAEVINIDLQARDVILRDGRLPFDSLILASGVSHHYFGNDQWAKHAPGLKTVEDALEIRRRILLAFEAAEREPDPEKRRAWLRFLVVGGGPTGVELAGALGELAHHTLKDEFHRIDPGGADLLLVEGLDRILPTYPPDLSARAARSLDRLGVAVRTHTRVTRIEEGFVTLLSDGQEERVPAQTVLWAAGVQASCLGQVLAKQTGVPLDEAGRVIVQPDLSIAGHPDIFVIGDLAHFAYQGNKPLPGVAPVAIQQGRYVAQLFRRRLQGETHPGFIYRDKGSLAVIGRNAAVADFGLLRFSGWPAWLLWVFVHIAYLIEFDNKLLVLIQWAWMYFTRKRGARLITGQEVYPRMEQAGQEQ